MKQNRQKLEWRKRKEFESCKYANKSKFKIKKNLKLQERNSLRNVLQKTQNLNHNNVLQTGLVWVDSLNKVTPWSTSPLLYVFRQVAATICLLSKSFLPEIGQ